VNLLTPKDAARRANVSLSLIYGWVASGELKHLRVGAAGKRGRIRIEEADLAAFLEGKKSGTGRAKTPAPARARPVKLRHLHRGGPPS